MHILWVKSELLHPVDKGGKVRTYQMLRQLRRQHRLTYLTLDDGSGGSDAVARAEEYCHALVRIPFQPAPKDSARFYLELGANLFSSLPYVIAKYRVRALDQAIRDLVARGDVDLVVCDFLFPSINVPRDLGVPAVLFQHNVEAAIWERHAAVARGFLRRKYFGMQWRRLRAFEAAECRRFDHVVAVSRDDSNQLREQYGLASVSEVPTGVDTEFFRPSGRRERDRSRVVFTGSMDWMPNEDGITWFCDEVLPLIRQRVPEASLSIVGRSPSRAVKALATRHERVDVTGTVDDVRPFMEEAAAFVVPLRVGGGTRLKIFEAMAMEVPIVSTTIGAEGLPVRDGVELLIADDPQSFAASVVMLLEERDTARRLAAAAAARVRNEFGWTEAASRFARLCEELCAERTHPQLV